MEIALSCRRDSGNIDCALSTQKRKTSIGVPLRQLLGFKCVNPSPDARGGRGKLGMRKIRIGHDHLNLPPLFLVAGV